MRRIVTVPAACALLITSSLAQEVPVVPRNVVVMLTAGGGTGAGFIVHHREGDVVIVTARHVIDETSAVADATGWAPCARTVQVAFYPDYVTTYPARRARCNLDLTLDLAVIEMTAPAGVIPNLKPYPLGTPAAASDNFALTLIGHPDGHPWQISSKNLVSRYDPAIDDTNFEFTKEGIRKGFSGGPVMADGLVGMVIDIIDNGFALGLLWSRISEELASIDIKPNLPIGEIQRVVSFSPALAATLADDAARSALRRYAYALNEQRRAEILNVYPTVNQIDLDTLLGDTSQIHLTLANCVRTDGDLANALATRATYSCAYTLSLKRRTGRDEIVSHAPGKAKMTFELIRGPTSWLIYAIK